MNHDSKHEFESCVIRALGGGRNSTQRQQRQSPSQQHRTFGPGDVGGGLGNGIGRAILDPAGLGPQGVPALHGQGIYFKTSV